MLTVEVITDPNQPYYFWEEMSWAWADDSNDVCIDVLSICHLESTGGWVDGVVQKYRMIIVSALYLSLRDKDRLRELDNNKFFTCGTKARVVVRSDFSWPFIFSIIEKRNMILSIFFHLLMASFTKTYLFSIFLSRQKSK